MVKGKSFPARSLFPVGRLNPPPNRGGGLKVVKKGRSRSLVVLIVFSGSGGGEKCCTSPLHFQIFSSSSTQAQIFRGRRWGAAWAGKWSKGGMPDFRAKKACSGLEKKIEPVCFFTREQTFGPKMAFLDLNVWAKKKGERVAMRWKIGQ